MEAAVIHHAAVIKMSFIEGSLPARTNCSPASSNYQDPSGFFRRNSLLLRELGLLS